MLDGDRRVWWSGSAITAEAPAAAGMASLPAVRVGNIAALRARTSDGHPVQTSGYYGAFSGGGGVYDPDPSDTTSADDGGSVIVGPGGIRYKRRVDGDIYNAAAWGALGDATTDNTQALDNAWRYIRARSPGTYPGPAAVDWTSTAPALGNGRYVYNGNGLTQQAGNSKAITIRGQGKAATGIILGAGKYFLDFGDARSTLIEGISFFGGAGAVRYNQTANNVSDTHIIRDCGFYYYTVCAIGNNSEDMPHVKIDGCIFFGSISGGTIGIAMSGYVDQGQVTNCHFFLNKYDIIDNGINPHYPC